MWDWIATATVPVWQIIVGAITLLLVIAAIDTAYRDTCRRQNIAAMDELRARAMRGLKLVPDPKEKR